MKQWYALYVLLCSYEGLVQHKQYFVTASKGRSNIKNAGLILLHSVETNIDPVYGSSDNFLTHSSFGLKDRQKQGTVFDNFQNPCFAHDRYN